MTLLSESTPMDSSRSEKRMSGYKFAVRLAKAFSLSRGNIARATMENMASWMARRPRDSSLDTSRARRILRTPFYDMELAIETFKREYKEK